MIKFMKTNAFNFVFSFLLLLIIAIGAYGTRQVETLQSRVSDLEQGGAATDGKINVVDTRFLERTASLETQLTAVSAQLEHLCTKLDDLLLVLLKGSKGITSPEDTIRSE